MVGEIIVGIVILWVLFMVILSITLIPLVKIVTRIRNKIKKDNKEINLIYNKRKYAKK